MGRGRDRASLQAGAFLSLGENRRDHVACRDAIRQRSVAGPRPTHRGHPWQRNDVSAIEGGSLVVWQAGFERTHSWNHGSMIIVRQSFNST